MIIREPYRLPEEKQQELRRAQRLEGWTLFFLFTIVVVIYLTLGQSQAMKAAWIEDLLSLIPPTLFLIVTRFRGKAPTARFPYGFRGLGRVAFFGASLALLGLGAYMLIDSAIALIKAHHPTIGTIELFGHRVWLGWVMIAALVYSAIPPVILGRLKMKPAERLHEKTLYADASMNKADWMTAVAAIVGILGIGLGFWWADAVAACLISLDVLKDGYMHGKNSLFELIDQRPLTLRTNLPMGITDKIRSRLRELDWVEDADVRLRTDGVVFAGEAYIVPRDTHQLVERMQQAVAVAEQSDWRIYDVVATPVASLKERQVEE